MKKLIWFTILLVATISFYSSRLTIAEAKAPDYANTDTTTQQYQCFNCSGSKIATSCDSVTYYVTKDSINNRSIPADSGKVTPATFPSFVVSLNRGYPIYELHIKAGIRGAGIYKLTTIAWADTCQTPYYKEWVAQDTTTDNLIRKCLKPTTAGRTLDVAATGEAGADFTNVLNSAEAPQWLNVRVQQLDYNADTAWVTARGQINLIKTKTDSLNFGGLARGTGLKVDVQRIDGDSVTADNLEKVFDGDTTWGTNAPITLTQWFVNSDSATDGVIIKGGQYGIRVIGTVKEGFSVTSANASAVNFAGAGGFGDLVLGNGSGHIWGYMDSVLWVNGVSDQVTEIQNYWGAFNGGRQHFMSFGTANKDSIITFDGATKKATIKVWRDISDPTIPDSTLQTNW